MGSAQKDDALFKKVLPQAAQVHRTRELISQVCLICAMCTGSFFLVCPNHCLVVTPNFEYFVSRLAAGCLICFGTSFWE